MSRGLVEILAGKPDKTKYYTIFLDGQYVRVVGLYYGRNPNKEITLLGFESFSNSLIEIFSYNL